MSQKAAIFGMESGHMIGGVFGEGAGVNYVCESGEFDFMLALIVMRRSYR